MKLILIAGISIVNLALISYTIAVYNQLKSGLTGRAVLSFLTIGVVFDITATVCMVIGSSQGPVTLHGVIGYSSLVGMLVDTVFSYRHAIRKGSSVRLSKNFMNWTRIAYFYWILAYLTGTVLVAMRH